MKKYRDGQEVTMNEVKYDWAIESYNAFLKATTLISDDKTLGVTFYEGYEKGTIFRNE